MLLREKDEQMQDKILKVLLRVPLTPVQLNKLMRDYFQPILNEATKVKQDEDAGYYLEILNDLIQSPNFQQLPTEKQQEIRELRDKLISMAL